MIKSNNKQKGKDNTNRLSVLDTLLNRNGDDDFENEELPQLRQTYSDSDNNSHHVSPPSSPNVSDNGVTNSTVESPLIRGTKTPTNRAEQLPLLLARNYYTAPPCLLRFINTTSSIRSYAPTKRDSDGTVIDNEFEPIIDCNVETNDEMDNFAFDNDGPETFSIGTMTDRTSLMSDPQFRETHELPYMGVDPADLSMALHSVEPPYAQRFDKGCSPFPVFSSVRPKPVAKTTMDIGTSPMIFEDSGPLDNHISTPRLEPEIELKPESTELDSYVPEAETNDFETIETIDVDSEPEFADLPDTDIPTVNLVSPDPPAYSTLKSGNFSPKNAELSVKRQLPVYCRSLLYRIRVPLSKRLKNVDEDVLTNSLASPLNSGTRINLSCDRIYSFRSRPTNSVDRTDSVLRLSDLESTATDSVKPRSRSRRVSTEPRRTSLRSKSKAGARKPAPKDRSSATTGSRSTRRSR